MNLLNLPGADPNQHSNRAPAFISTYPKLGWSLVILCATAGFFLVGPVVDLFGGSGNTLDDYRPFGIPIILSCGLVALLAAYGRFKRQHRVICASAIMLFSSFVGVGAFVALWAIAAS